MSKIVQTTFRLFSYQLHLLLRWALLYPRLLVVFFILTVTLSIPGLQMLKMNLIGDDLYEPNIQASLDFDSFRQRFRQQYSAVFFSEEQIWNEKLLCEMRHRLENLRISNPQITEIASIFDLKVPTFNSQKNSIHYFPLLSLNCENPTLSEYDLSALKKSPWSSIFLGKKNELSYQIKFEESKSTHSEYYNENPLNNLISEFQKNHISDRVTGSAAFLNAVFRGIDHGQIVNILVFLVILILFRIFWGTWKSGFLYLLTIICNITIIFGLKGYFNSPYDTLSDSIVLLVAIANLEDFVFISYLQLKFQMSARKSIRQLLIASFLTSFTTFIGFSSLIISDIYMIKRLGFWIALSALIEWVILFLILPAALQLFSRKLNWVNSSRSFTNNLLAPQHNFHLPRWLAILAPIGLLSIPFFHINHDDLSLFRDTHPFKQATLAYRDVFSRHTSLHIIFPPGTKPESIQTLNSLLTEVQDISAIESASEQLEFLLKNIPQEHQPMVLDQLKLSSSFQKYYSNLGEEQLIVWTKKSDLNSIQILKNKVEQLCHNYNCIVTGSGVKNASISLLIPKTLTESLILSLILTSLIIAWVAYSLYGSANVFQTILSSFFGPGIVMLFVAIFQVQADFLTTVFLTALIGIAGDNTLQFLFAGKNKDLNFGINSMAPAAFITTVTMCICSLLFVVSDFYPSQKFGPLLCFGLAITYLGDVYILRNFLSTNKF